MIRWLERDTEGFGKMYHQRSLVGSYLVDKGVVRRRRGRKDAASAGTPARSPKHLLQSGCIGSGEGHRLDAASS